MSAPASSSEPSTGTSFGLLAAPLGLARGLGAALSLTAGALPIHAVQLSVLPLALVHRPTFRSVIDHSQAAFTELLFMVHCAFGPKTTLAMSAEQGAFSDREWLQLVAGVTESLLHHDSSDSSSSDDEDEQGTDDRTLLVSNHQTLYDWVFVWFAALRLDRAHALKIILKQTPKYVPMFGPGMVLFDFIFLSRNRTKDIPQLHAAMDALLTASPAPSASRPGALSANDKWLLVFPEGTILTANTNRITREYAARQGMPAETVPSATLIPRTTGLGVILGRLFASPEDLAPSQTRFSRLLDVTISFAFADSDVNRAAWTAEHRFPGNIFTPRVMYLTPSPPALRIACHFGKRTPPGRGAGDVEQWTMDLWREKEARVHWMRSGKVPREATRQVEVPLRLKGFWPRHLVPYVVGVPAVAVAVGWCVSVYWWGA